MTETTTVSRVTLEGRDARRTSVSVILPAFALIAWLGAVATVAVLGLNDLGSPMLYGWQSPSGFGFALLAASFVLMGVAVWTRGLPYAYAAAAPLVPLGTGARLLVDVHLMAAVVFAVFLFLVVEYLSSVRRFDQIVRAAMALEETESKPVKRFVFRYFIGSVVLIAAYAVLLAVFIRVVVPGLAGAVSPRMAAGLEIETAWGISIFLLIFFGVVMLGRLAFDGLRPAAPEEHETETVVVDKSSEEGASA